MTIYFSFSEQLYQQSRFLHRLMSRLRLIKNFPIRTDPESFQIRQACPPHSLVRLAQRR